MAVRRPFPELMASSRGRGYSPTEAIARARHYVLGLKPPSSEAAAPVSLPCLVKDSLGEFIKIMSDLS